MKMFQTNRIRFTTLLAGRIIKEAVIPLDSRDRVNILIINDFMFERNRSKKVELLAKVYDHAKHCYKSDELADTFMSTIPSLLKSKLQTA